MRKTLLKIFTALIFTAGFTFAQAASLQTTKGEVEFLAIGKPAAIKIRGKGQDLKSQLKIADKQLIGSFTFNLDSLDTGIELRTNHMKEKYLETGKFKNAELTLKPVSVTQDLCKESAQLEKVVFEGTLKLHGIEKPVKGDFDVKSEKTAGGTKGSAKVRFEINLSEYQVEIPVYMGIKVADRVENTVDLEWTCAQ